MVRSSKRLQVNIVSLFDNILLTTTFLSSTVPIDVITATGLGTTADMHNLYRDDGFNRFGSNDFHTFAAGDMAFTWMISDITMKYVKYKIMFLDILIPTH